MKPLWEMPSFGTVHAMSSRILVLALMFLSPLLVFTILALSPSAVIATAAWKKSPHLHWRISVVGSVVAAMVLSIYTSPLNFPHGFPMALPVPDPIFRFVDPDLLALRIVLNGLIAVSLGMLPLSMFSTIHTLRTKKSLTSSPAK